MVTGLKTRAAAATDSKTGQTLPGEPPATDGAGTVSEATSTPGQSRVGWGLSPTVLTMTPNCISIERNGGQGLQATAGDQLRETSCLLSVQVGPVCLNPGRFI